MLLKLAAAYCKRHSKTLFLLVALLLLLFWVYHLYGLPIGPAVYAAILMLLLTVLVGICGFRGYCKRYHQLMILKEQASSCLGELPPAADLLEAQYQELARLLEKRAQDTQQAMRQTALDATNYYTRWSHQIKTPIAAMRLLLQENEPGNGAVEQELLKTEQYVEMVLQYQRLEHPSNDLLLQEYPLEVLVKRAIKKTAALFIHRKIGMELAAFSCMVLTDEKWLVFVVEQLLTNAVKYTKEGKVSIYLEEPCTLVIKDTGIGIREEDLPRVFEWGYTGYNGRMEQNSTGIGLNLCQQTMSLLGNQIMIFSKVGEGTTVKLLLSRTRFEIE